MKSSGYIYIANWEKFQHYRDRNIAWIKLYLDLLGDDKWLALSPADRVLLQGVWMLTGRYGNGRVRADSGWLNAQLRIRKGSLDRLNQAGFIRIRASKAASTTASTRASTEGSKEPKRKNARERLAADTAAAARVEENPPTQNGWTGAGEARAEFLRLAAEKKAMP